MAERDTLRPEPGIGYNTLPHDIDSSLQGKTGHLRLRVISLTGFLGHLSAGRKVITWRSLSYTTGKKGYGVLGL